MTKSTNQHNSAQHKEIFDKPPANLSRQGGMFSVIIAEVMDSPFLPPGAKLLYTKISGLCNREGYCWATNKFLADELFKSTCTIKRWLRILQDQGLIVVQLDLCDKGVARKIFLQIGIKEKFKSDQNCTYPKPSRKMPSQHIVRSDHFCTEGGVKNDPCNNIILEEEEDEDPVSAFGFAAPKPPLISRATADESFEQLCELPGISSQVAANIATRYTPKEIVAQVTKISKLQEKSHYIPDKGAWLITALRNAYGVRKPCPSLRVKGGAK